MVDYLDQQDSGLIPLALVPYYLTDDFSQPMRAMFLQIINALGQNVEHDFLRSYHHDAIFDLLDVFIYFYQFCIGIV